MKQADPPLLSNLEYPRLDLFFISFRVMESEIRMVFNNQAFDPVNDLIRAVGIPTWSAIEDALADLSEEKYA